MASTLVSSLYPRLQKPAMPANSPWSQSTWILPLLGVCLPKRNKNTHLHKNWVQMFIAAIFITGKKWKQTKCLSADEEINKMWTLHTMEYYSAIKSTESPTPK